MPSRERRLLDKDKEIRKLKGAVGHYFSCTISAAIENKKLKQELVDIKKKLDVAVDKLKGIKAYYDDSYADPNFVNWHIVAQRLANDADDALKEITALEQKDVK